MVTSDAKLVFKSEDFCDYSFCGRIIDDWYVPFVVLMTVKNHYLRFSTLILNLCLCAIKKSCFQQSSSLPFWLGINIFFNNYERLNCRFLKMIFNCNFMQVPAFLEIHDIAGLVRGAHQGQGLGNSFLSHIRAVDGIFHVLRKTLELLLPSSLFFRT